jgi:hypothetical protein
VARRRPLAWLATLGAAFGLAWKHRSREAGAPFALKKVFIKEFLQAGWIAQAVLRAGDVSHLHGHFCHGVATITWFASRLSGLPFSFTAHAKDIYQTELNPGRLLERKLGAARFVATCTCANAEVLRARHPRPDDVHAIYHGLDTDWFSPAAAAGPRGGAAAAGGGPPGGEEGLRPPGGRLRPAAPPRRVLPLRHRGRGGQRRPALRAQIAGLGLAECVEAARAVTRRTACARSTAAPRRSRCLAA